jgi:hypothetical protein
MSIVSLVIAPTLAQMHHKDDATMMKQKAPIEATTIVKK